MLRRQLTYTAAFTFAVLIAVLALDFLVNLVWLPGATPYTPVVTIFITSVVAPPFTFFLVHMNAKVQQAQAHLATERAQRLIEVERARDLAERATLAKSEFLANMSHEIRTPLNGVLGMAQSLASDDLTPAQREKIAVVLDSGASLLTLLNDVLELSKIEAGKLEISPVSGDLLHTMKRIRQLFQTHAEDKGLSLVVRHASSLPQRLSYDPVRVRQCGAMTESW